ncbi:MAG: EAL domain-containing protein [Betaproteobacteria bacterium]|nr:EAL domain-containing protein [Betaproteobacteria bacterium]MBU6510751.1 EAL domain-containing protein [Betaproteobacteria bacterium]MDE2151753.1 EAL domain-containing protein [Betaproteobacteria bacterium]
MRHLDSPLLPGGPAAAQAQVGTEVIRRLAAQRDLERFFELAAAEAARVLHADGAAMIEIDGPAHLRYRFFQGLPEDYRRLAAGYRFEMADGTAGLALRCGEPVFTADYPASDHAMPDFVRCGLRSNLIVPVGPPEDRRGVIALAWFGRAPARAPDAEQLAVVAMVADLMYWALHRQHLEHSLQQQARHDALTGLPNRRYLLGQLETLLRHQSPGAPLAVAWLDLDGFKPVNDQHGHEQGDAVLGMFAERLRGAVRENDFVARLGGDEFAVVFAEVHGEPELHDLLDRLGERLNRPYRLREGLVVECPASIGAAWAGAGSLDAEALLRDADRAMYLAKGRHRPGQAAWRVFSVPPPAPGTDGGAQLPGELELHYQPVFDLDRRRVLRLESLARLRRDGELLAPAEFLGQLDRRQHRQLLHGVLDASLHQLAQWELQGLGGLGVSVNVEPHSLGEADLAQRVAERLQHHGLHPSRLTLEILERGELLSRDAALRQLTLLRAMGVRLAVDDLGAGHSSLLRLRSLPMDEIKLDQAFVRDIARNLQDIAFVRSVRELAHGLHVELVAEGAENAEILEILRALGIRQVQGWGIARAVPARELPQLVARLGRWQPPRVDSPLALAYTRHLNLDSHILGLLHNAPAQLRAFHPGEPVPAELDLALREVPAARELYRQQRVLLADMARHHELDLRLPMRRYRQLGERLRELLALAARMGPRASETA